MEGLRSTRRSELRNFFEGIIESDNRFYKNCPFDQCIIELPNGDKWRIALDDNEPFKNMTLDRVIKILKSRS